MVAGDEARTATMNTPLRAEATVLGPVSLSEAVAALDPVDSVWTGPDEPTIVTSGRVETISAGGDGRFGRIRRRGAEVFDRIEGSVPDSARPRLLGGFSFFGTEQLEEPWTGFEPSIFSLPAIQVAIPDSATWVTAIGQEPTGEGGTLQATVESVGRALRSARTSEAADRVSGSERGFKVERPKAITDEQFRVEKTTWLSRVRTITERIRSGGLQKAVLAQGLDVDLDGQIDRMAVLERLRERYPDCYRFGFHGHRSDGPDPAGADAAVFLGASPETLVKKNGPEVWTEALAGTVGRGKTLDDDTTNETRLRSDPKILEEHDLVIDHIENRLEAVGNEVAIGDRFVRKLATVQHLQSPLSTTAEAGTHVLDVVEALHPTPAVGGLPPDAAKAVIRETESVERGWYAAPVGWFDADGNGTFAVGIRSALATDSRATLYAGNGIVADSDPETEWAEIQLKFGPIRNAIR